MAPLLHLLLALVLSNSVLASPHVARNVYHHAHRAVANPIDVRADPALLPLPKRQRSLNKRCVPRSSNSTTTTTTSSPSTPPAAINVAPLPSSSSSAPHSDASSSTPSYAPSASTPSPSPSYSPTPTPTPTPTSSPSPAQTASSSNSGEPSFLIGTQNGQATFYTPGLGACGITNSATDFIAAVSHSLFDIFPGYDGVNPNTNPVCGLQVAITYNGKQVDVTITDRCEGCALTDLDLSPAAFNVLNNPAVGRFDISWIWKSPVP